MSLLLVIASAVGMGLASALVPVVNAEALVAAAGAGLRKLGCRDRVQAALLAVRLGLRLTQDG